MSRPGPATRITAHSTSLVCQDTDLRGDITLGEGVIVHPKATILALGGPIVVGPNCLIEEMAVIVNRRKEIMRIGQGNHFMLACRVESPSIGEYNTFHPRSRASAGVRITDHCTLGANTILPSPTLAAPEDQDQTELLPPYTVIFGANSDRRTWDGSGEQAEKGLREKHVEYLREIIPKYNRLRVV